MDEAKTMTVAEIGVMREIVKWRRAARYEFMPMNSRYLGHWATWREGWRSFERQVTVDRSAPGKFAVREAGRFTSNEWYPAKTFTEAVDMLVALGYLPTRFSTAYRAGWHAAEVWFQSESFTHEEFKAMFQDPSNISFPAVSE